MADAHTLASLARLIDIMARLRAPGGCPWDREQTHDSLRPYVVEEAYEVLDAIESGDPEALCDELGDLLLQVLFHAEIASETGAFRLADVARAIAEKLERRHPHVFADVEVRDADEVVRNWRRIKAEERANMRSDGDTSGLAGVLAAIPRALPALTRAQEVGEKLAHAGFDWPDVSGVLAKVDEERQELGGAIEHGDQAAARAEVGDLLLTAASLARHLGVSAEMALRDATARLERRVAHVEAAAHAAGRSLESLDDAERERLWRAAKS
jgi:tetrapyrrole methylase family protein/MazG family protein/ATP diphosphatase